MKTQTLHKPWDERRRQAEAYDFGMWIFLAGEALFFGALVFTYFVLRLRFPAETAVAAAATATPFGAANTAILLVSSGFIAAAENLNTVGLRKTAAAFIATALLLGSAFLVVKGFEYADDLAKGLWPGAHFALGRGAGELFWAFYWVATGVHAVHVLIGLGLFFRLLAFARASALGAHAASLRATALYWHFVDVVWIVLFPLLYLVGRNP